MALFQGFLQQCYSKRGFLISLQSAEGGRGLDSPPLGAIMDILIDTTLVCGGVFF